MHVAHEERFCCAYGPDSKGQLVVKCSKGSCQQEINHGGEILPLFASSPPVANCGDCRAHKAHGFEGFPLVFEDDEES